MSVAAPHIPNAADERTPLPVVVIGGYLGAGKTTLVNHLLRHAGGRRIAVLVNDFGDTNIDADLLADAAGQAEADVLSLAGGCLCCSFGDDLVGTLGRLARRTPALDIVLIELSGVAVPGPVLQSMALQPLVRAAGTWVVVDQAQIGRLLRDRYLADVVQAQLRDADWLVLNKPDLVDEEQRRALPGLLAPWAARARRLDAAAATLPTELVLGWRGDALRADVPDMPDAPDAPDASDTSATGDPAAGLFARIAWQRPDAVQTQAAAAQRFVSRTLALPDGTDLAALGAALAQPDSGVLRAKGFARDAQGATQVLQVAGAQWQLSPAARPLQGAGRLVLIALHEQLDAALASASAAGGRCEPQPSPT